MPLHSESTYALQIIRGAREGNRILREKRKRNFTHDDGLKDQPNPHFSISMPVPEPTPDICCTPACTRQTGAAQLQPTILE